MATLSTTLGSAKDNSPRYSYNYRPPPMSNPYRNIGANVGFQNFGDPGMFASLAARNDASAAKPIPGSAYQAEYNYDPILSRISAMGDMTVANAQSEAANLKRRALIEAGDVSIAGDLGADANTIEAARQNPFSTRAKLTRDFTERGRALDEALNQQNLFFSGERVNRLAEQERGRAEAETQFNQVLRDLFWELGQGVLTSQQNAILAGLGPGGAPGGTSAPTSAPAPPPTAPAPAPAGIIPPFGGKPYPQDWLEPPVIPPYVNPQTDEDLVWRLGYG